MSKTVEITSPTQFQGLLSSSKAVVVDFYADWCGPCKAIAPIYQNLSNKYSASNLVTFAKVNTDNQPEVAQQYDVTASVSSPLSAEDGICVRHFGAALPTFIYYENGKEHTRSQGANAHELKALIPRWTKIAAGELSGESSGSGSWKGAGLPRGYKDVTDEIDLRGMDLLNADSDFGSARTLFESSIPSLLGKGKAKATSSSEGTTDKDWIESDTDEQLMLYVPFQATLKIHTLQITSLPPAASEDDDSDEVPMRPKTIHLYTNRAHNLGFEEADDIPAAQKITLSPSDWDTETGTAKVELRFVKFQNVTSLVVFIVDGEGEGEKTRIDRVRIIGETGEKREMGKLEKIGDHDD